MSTQGLLIVSRSLRRGAVSRRALLGFPVVLGMLLLSACGSTQPDTESQVSFLVVSGDGQRAPVGTELPEAVVAKLVNPAGAPVKGQTVNFRVTSGGGSVFAGSATTNGQGIARERWTLGLSTGEPQFLEARMVDPETGEARTLGVFTATGLPLAPARLMPVESCLYGGSCLYEGRAGGQVTTSVRVVDVHGNGVPGETVTWHALEGEVTVRAAAESSVTDEQGEARMQWVGEATGRAGVHGRWSGEAVFISIRIDHGEPARLVGYAVGPGATDAGAGAIPEFDLIGGLPGGFPILAHDVGVKDRFGNPVPNAPLTLRVVEGGGSLRGADEATGTLVVETAYPYGTLYGSWRSGPPVPYWRLGPSAGRNVLSVSLAGVGEVRFTAEARSPFIHILSPVEGQTLGNDVLVVRGYVCLPAGWGVAAAHAGDLTQPTRLVSDNLIGECSVASEPGFDPAALPSGPVTVSLSTTHEDGTRRSASVTVTKP